MFEFIQPYPVQKEDIFCLAYPVQKEDLFCLDRQDLCRVLEAVTGEKPTANMRENLPFVDLVLLVSLAIENPSSPSVDKVQWILDFANH